MRKLGDRQVAVLAALGQHPEGATCHEVARNVGCRHSYISKVLETLIDRGLVRYEGRWRNIYAGRPGRADRERYGIDTLLFFAVGRNAI